MAEGFFGRNKKKSALAALLLLLRQRKALILLFLAVVAASTAFVAPTSWIGGKVGALRMGRRSVGELAAEFKAARIRKASSGPVAPGWASLFGGASVIKTVPNSVDYVKGGRADLGAPKSVAGIVHPAEAEAAGAAGVALAPSDLGGERAGAAEDPETFAGGVMKGLLGGDGKGAPGGAFAGLGFFRGRAGAIDEESQSLVVGGLANASSAPAAKGRAAGPSSVRIPAGRVKAAETRAMHGAAGARALTGKRALTQLAQGNGLALLGTTYCKPPNCPGEFGATQTGAIYDGNAINAGILTGSPDGLMHGAVQTPTEADLASNQNSANLDTCMQLVQQCEADKQEPTKRQANIVSQIGNLNSQMGGACGNPCNCGPCQDLKGRISSLCSGPLAAAEAEIAKPCNLPSYCADLGVEPPSAPGGPGRNLCNTNSGSCGCGSFMCDMSCFFGS